jgi:hypothetical protein
MVDVPRTPGLVTADLTVLVALIRAKLAALVLSDVDNLATEAWTVTATRFPALLTNLSDPDYLDDVEHELNIRGLIGPEMTMRLDVLKDHGLPDSTWLSVAASILRSLAELPGLDVPARAVADVCDAFVFRLSTTHAPEITK